MKILQTRNCKICNIPFGTMVRNQYYCCVKCRNVGRYNRRKEKELEIVPEVFPIWICYKCAERVQVTHDPINEWYKYQDDIKKHKCKEYNYKTLTINQ